VRRFVAATIASKSYLALARVTAESFRRHNPDIPFCTLLADGVQGQFDPALETFRTLELSELAIDEPRRFCFQYAELELSYACTPYLIDHLLSEGYDGVIFLKQETLVLDSLAPVFEKLQEHSLLLTPHFLEPPGGDAALQWELNILRAGVFNGGFIAFSNREESRRVLAWWKQKTRRGCFRAVEEGVHFEQRWLDFFPSLAPHCHILRDPGMNVGHWNLAERRIRVRDSRVTADGVPCCVFRFSGYEPHVPNMVTKYNLHLTVDCTGEAAEVFRLYQSLLDSAGYTDLRKWPYAFGSFDNGQPIPEAVRRIYHDLNDDVRRFGDPFATAHPESFYRWLATSAGMPQP
jgi:hypothetical protein